jgi:hypothetical protein
MFPYAARFKGILGEKNVYFFATSRLERHWIGSHGVTRELIHTARDELTQVNR